MFSYILTLPFVLVFLVPLFPCLCTSQWSLGNTAHTSQWSLGNTAHTSQWSLGNTAHTSQWSLGNTAHTSQWSLGNTAHTLLSCLRTTHTTASLAEWLRRPPPERKVPGSNPAFAGIFSGSSHTSDFKIGTPVAALPGAWRYRISTGTGRPGVSIL